MGEGRFDGKLGCRAFKKNVKIRRYGVVTLSQFWYPVWKLRVEAALSGRLGLMRIVTLGRNRACLSVRFLGKHRKGCSGPRGNAPLVRDKCHGVARFMTRMAACVSPRVACMVFSCLMFSDVAVSGSKAQGGRSTVL